MQTRNLPRHSRRGNVKVVAIVLGVVAVFAVVVCAGMAGIMLPALAKARSSARQIKCGTQVRNTIQAMTIFAQGNKDSYPLPSIIDANNATVATGGRAKDSTNNILSVLCFNGSISPELLYCPSEANSNIVVHRGYQMANPSAAVKPVDALWDPSLRCDFTTGQGHISYANLMPSGDESSKDLAERGRLNIWSNTFNATEAVFGNRGPAITGGSFDKNSNTLAIHGGRSTWEGNIGYNDNHVNFETVFTPPGVTYGSRPGKPDNIFIDEADDKNAVNLILGVWTVGGSKPSEFKGIHD